MTEGHATYELPGSGHNLTPFDQHSAAIEDLYLEAKNWLDDKGVQSQSDADGVSKLLDLLRKAAKEADEARKEEKRPHDEAAKAVQSKWKPIIDRAELAQKVCKQALTPYLQKVEAEQRAAEEEARRQAEAAEIAAQKAFEQSGLSDLEAREEAERLATAAKEATAEANRAGKQKAHAKGGGRAAGLRTSYHAEITDDRAFAAYVWQNHRVELSGFLLELAGRLVRNGQRGIPGVTVHEKKEAA